MIKNILFNTEARDALKRGVDSLANAVKVTLGPKGKNVVIDHGAMNPTVTKDGVTVAKEIFLKNPVENLGAQLIKEAASKTADLAGDGTTTSVVLAQAIVLAGLKNIAAGANPMDLKRGIDKAVIAVVENLKKQSIPVGKDFKKIEHVATISANNDKEIGKLIADAMRTIGKDGVIAMEDSKTSDTTVETVQGMQFDRGYLSRFFITHPEKMEVVFENAVILITDKKIVATKELLGILEKCSKADRPLVIIAEDIEQEPLGTLIVNKLKGNLRVVALRAPAFGDRRKEILEDIAILTGGAVISEERGFKLENAELGMLGKCEKITIDVNNTLIVGGRGNKKHVTERVNQLRKIWAETESTYDKEKIQERLAKLTGGVAIVYVGAATEVEMIEKKFRVEDALAATRAATEEGILPGGGTAYIHAVKCLDKVKGRNSDENTGIKIIRDALYMPLEQICLNSGVDPGRVTDKIEGKDKNFGYNAFDDKYEDLTKAGIIDPTKVARVALENAASVSGMILITDCVLSLDKLDQDTGADIPPFMKR